jgi:hypothetical protein
MGDAQQATVTADGIYFELERFEIGDGDQLRLTGRWFGVRGRRFMRPTLTVDVDDDHYRALADLDHKPWAAEDGEPWEAVFPLREGVELVAAELSVAPDIAVQLPAPGSRRNKRVQRLPALPRRDSMLAGWPTPAPEPREAAGGPAEATGDVPPASEPLGEIAGADGNGELEEENAAEILALGSELEATRGKLEAAWEELEATRGKLEAAWEELEVAREKLGARDAELHASRAELADAVAGRAAAQRSLETALTERDRLAAERDGLAAEREQLLGERDRLAGEGGRAGSEVQRLTSELVQLQARLEQATRERDEAVSAHGAALVMRNASRVFPAYRPHTGWFRRGVALVVVLGAAIALLTVLHVL